MYQIELFMFKYAHKKSVVLLVSRLRKVFDVTRKEQNKSKVHAEAQTSQFNLFLYFQIVKFIARK